MGEDYTSQSRSEFDWYNPLPCNSSLCITWHGKRKIVQSKFDPSAPRSVSQKNQRSIEKTKSQRSSAEEISQIIPNYRKVSGAQTLKHHFLLR